MSGSRSRRASFAAVVAAVLASSLCANAAWAQDQPSMPTADELIERGVALREAGRDEEALSEFRRAWEMWPSPRTEAQLALACQAVGRWVEAAEHLSTALAASSDPWITRTRAPLEQAMTLLVARVGRLEIAGTAPGAQVLVSGRPRVFREGAPVFVEPGSSELEIRATGYVAVTLGIDVRAGEVMRARVRMTREPSRDVPAPDTSGPVDVLEPRRGSRRGRPERTTRVGGLRLTWVALGTAAAFGGAAIYTWARAEDAADELATSCGATRSCAMAQVDDTGGPTFVTLTNVFLVGALLSAGVSGVLMVLEWPRMRPTRRVAITPGGLRFDATF